MHLVVLRREIYERDRSVATALTKAFQTAKQQAYDRLLCGCQAHYIRGLFFSYDSFTSRPKRDLLLCVARHRAVTLTRNAPLSKAQSPGISVSRIEPFREFPLPVLPVVESFPGAMSPLGSKEPN